MAALCGRKSPSDLPQTGTVDVTHCSSSTSLQCMQCTDDAFYRFTCLCIPFVFILYCSNSFILSIHVMDEINTETHIDISGFIAGLVQIK